MSAAWVTVLALAAVTISIKAVGPIALGGRELPTPLVKVIDLLAPAILAGLIVIGTFTDADGELVVDARAAGLGAAAAVYALNRRWLVGAVAAAAVTAASVRALA